MADFHFRKRSLFPFSKFTGCDCECVRYRLILNSSPSMQTSNESSRGETDVSITSKMCWSVTFFDVVDVVDVVDVTGQF